jgi:hypothetical protein
MLKSFKFSKETAVGSACVDKRIDEVEFDFSFEDAMNSHMTLVSPVSLMMTSMTLKSSSALSERNW